MALKKFDIPEIDSAITDAKREEQLQKQQETAEKIAAVLQAFLAQSPDIINAMRAVIPLLDANKFSDQLSEDLRKSANSMAAQVGEKLRKSAGEIEKRFIADVTPLVERVEQSRKRVSVPMLAFGIIVISIVFLAAFLGIMIYANASNFHSDSLSWIITLVIIAWGVCVTIVTYLSRKQ